MKDEYDFSKGVRGKFFHNSDIETLPAFEPKPKAPRPVANDPIEKIAEANSFPSRQAVGPPARVRSGRRYRTGRNQQINIKATSQGHRAAV